MLCQSNPIRSFLLSLTLALPVGSLFILSALDSYSELSNMRIDHATQSLDPLQQPGYEHNPKAVDLPEPQEPGSQISGTELALGLTLTHSLLAQCLNGFPRLWTRSMGFRTGTRRDAPLPIVKISRSSVASVAGHLNVCMRARCDKAQVPTPSRLSQGCRRL